MRRKGPAGFVAAILALGLLLGLAPPIRAQSSAVREIDATIRIKANVDGRSQLVLRGDTAQWMHFDFAAPGRHGFVNLPTVIDGVSWFPTWPDIPDAENRDCQCQSSVFTGVSPSVPVNGTPGSLRRISSRGLTRILQQPTSANGYSLVIEFDDNALGGPADYDVEVRFRMVGIDRRRAPEPEGGPGTTRVFRFDVTLSNPSSEPVSVTWHTEDRTAIAGLDYRAASGTVRFAPGKTSGVVGVVVLGDAELEQTEWFVVKLDRAQGAAIVSGETAGPEPAGSARGRIRDNSSVSS